MNAYNPLSSMKRLESAGLDRQHAEAIAFEIGESTSDLVTNDTLTLKLDAFESRLDAKMDAALNRQLVRIGVLFAALLTLACSVIGVLISLK